MSAFIALLIGVSPPAYFPEDLGKPTYRCSADGDWVVPLVDTGILAAYANVMEIANERPIFRDRSSEQKGMARTVRFTWLRTFHAPIVIRIGIGETGGGRVFATRLSGQGGYSYGSIADQLSKTLSRNEIKKNHGVVWAKCLSSSPPALRATRYGWRSLALGRGG